MKWNWNKTETKLKQNSCRTATKLFSFSFISAARTRETECWNKFIQYSTVKMTLCREVTDIAAKKNLTNCTFINMHRTMTTTSMLLPILNHWVDTLKYVRQTLKLTLKLVSQSFESYVLVVIIKHSSSTKWHIFSII